MEKHSTKASLDKLHKSTEFLETPPVETWSRQRRLAVNQSLKAKLLTVIIKLEKPT